MHQLPWVNQENNTWSKLLVIEDQLDALQKGKIFLNLDLANGYFHVSIKKKSRKYTALVTQSTQSIRIQSCTIWFMYQSAGIPTLHKHDFPTINKSRNCFNVRRRFDNCGRKRRTGGWTSKNGVRVGCQLQFKYQMEKMFIFENLHRIFGSWNWKWPCQVIFSIDFWVWLDISENSSKITHRYQNH